ncbi:Bifunctional uridylyltransferase/uridylyl-removing enzyme OS=Tsukamurella paurometabola (strain ATCC 8368 / DSM / CCUG 35730 / CIP 100753 / JCM 10117 /KCTC 9821 / NBRC 16120 / NCIMB 702349 / NCTC 13040) OX=521096 GN=glnD PE=3 SV=1 [Tsukamurella paurometabola]|uniref:Bifunctional uridylyltransferase/uridylyl-removing enzyme n=1 Tax=Tsukamurella paurometabola (strain ATCC 8368 / DSM 20162 / CCUG 35730 / CIP 100753 / JCM 10117 / KCTC 9821 / NBRC 16120 / NCIMB 702349 / NCTC 13040) TaxID=521096 RepID=D5UYC4_TSUPD|nr:[protein-PII] uridylyltransferase [Tsukamurella paurometabola]ADG78231.1 UTP-GlnB uridylyltransferase, GlnD [Tsukamurella paurometabola DSM 20162]SUP30787.1 PII uridylyl-transferase [Tsukamurella paurometabola]
MAAPHESTTPGRSGAATELVAARNRLLDRASGPHRIDPHTLRSSMADLAEVWLATHGAAAGIGPDSGLALVAVGGLGRRELLPYSDFDLILLHDDGVAPERVTEAAESIWYPLWDAHIKLDHSVRTVPQAVQVAASDLSAALGLLDARHIVGDEEITNLLISGVRRQWRADIRSRLDDLIAQAGDRWRRSGEIAHRAEPDLKSGRGGMRDVQLLQALSLAQLTDGIPTPSGSGVGRSGNDLAHAYERLLDVRTELHRISGRARDQLRAQDADEIAAALRLGDRFDLARIISDSGRTVAFAVDTGLRTASNALPRRGVSRLRRTPVRRPLADGVVAHAGEVALARDARPERDQGLTVRVAAAAAASGLPISASTLHRLADVAPAPRSPWPAETVADFLALLGAGRNAVPVIEALDRTGLWGRLLPEWGAVRDLPPRDAVHTWTVDRHLMEAAAYAANLATRVARPDLLVLGALLHDLGKGRGGDHSVIGAEIAVAIAARMGLSATDTATLEAMVRHHLLLPATSTRRDLDDPDTLEFVADRIGRDPVLLELLHALAEADSLATGPGVWGDWKSGLIGELVRRTGRVLDGHPPPEPEPVDPEIVALAADGGTHVRIDPAPKLGPHTYTATVVSPDRRGVLARTAAVLTLAGLRVQSAIVNVAGESAVDSFVVVPVFGDPPDPAVVRQRLLAALDGTDVIAELRERDAAAPVQGDEAAPPLRVAAPPQLRWFDGTAGTAVLEVRAGDTPGLLARIAAALDQAGLDVRWARAATLGATVDDVFCLDANGDETAFRARAEAAVAAVLPEAAPPAPPEDTQRP